MSNARALRFMTILATLALTSCGDIGLPEQGFATRYLGGSVGPTIGEQFDTTSDFSGHPLGGTAAARRARPSDICEATAQDRADDIAAEGYDETLQKHVHDAVLADCRVWSRRH